MRISLKVLSFLVFAIALLGAFPDFAAAQIQAEASAPESCRIGVYLVDLMDVRQHRDADLLPHRGENLQAFVHA